MVATDCQLDGGQHHLGENLRACLQGVFYINQGRKTVPTCRRHYLVQCGESQLGTIMPPAASGPVPRFLHHHGLSPITLRQNKGSSLPTLFLSWRFITAIVTNPWGDCSLPPLEPTSPFCLPHRPALHLPDNLPLPKASIFSLKLQLA